MIYRVYAILEGNIALACETQKAEKAAKEYMRMLNSGSYPRLALNGKQLTIVEADDWVYKKRGGRKDLFLQ